jgi:hypothetical protein
VNVYIFLNLPHFVFVWINGAPTQFRSYGAETTNLQQYQGSQPPHLLELRDATTAII